MSSYSKELPSEYAGVMPAGNRNGRAFRAQTNRCKQIYYLGTYDTEREAAAVHDRAVRATLAWSQRTRQRYNLADEGMDSEAGGATATQFIERMLADLRSRFPVHEELKDRINELEESVPAGSIEALDRSMSIAESMFARARSNSVELKKKFLEMAEELKELRARVTFMRQENADLTVRLEEAQTEKKRISVERKWTFKPVGADVPKDAAPEVVVFPAGSTVPAVERPVETVEEDAEISIPGEQQ